MDLDIPTLIENTLYFLALINPPSKILLLASRQPKFTTKEIISLSLRSNITAWCILIVLTAIGNFLLVGIFRVQIYSLSVAGGIVLFIVGLKAVSKGKFFEESEAHKLADLSIVPLAAPLIAGPGTMAAAISYASIHGPVITSVCLTLAILVNTLCMLLSQPIGNVLERSSATGPLIRITGLIVAAVAMQMIFNGAGTWIRSIL